MFGYIYKTTDLRNDKVYIGQHKSDTYLGYDYVGSGNIIRGIKNQCEKKNIPIEDVLKTEMIEECESFEELNEREMYWIDFYDSRYPNGYNLNDGGGGGNHNLGRKWSDEVNAKKGSPGEKNPMYGKHHTEETKAKIRAKQLGKKASPETRAKLSLARKNQVMSEEQKLHRAKALSDALKGRPKSEEHKKKLSEAKKGRVYINNGTVTKCVKPETLGSYDPSIWKRGKAKSNKPSPLRGTKHSEESKRKQSEKLKGRAVWNAGLTKETDPRVAKYVNTQRQNRERKKQEQEKLKEQENINV